MGEVEEKVVVKGKKNSVVKYFHVMMRSRV